MLTITIGRRTLAWLLALVLTLTSIWVAIRADAGIEPAGEGIARVYIAVGTGFPDALGVGPGAAANGAPIILVPTNPPLNDATIAELERLDPREVVIVGGTAVVSTAVEDALEELLPNAAFSRIAGSNRYITNPMFSESVFPVESWVAVPPSAFTAPSPDIDDATIGAGSAFNATSATFLAPVHLPHGAEILELRAQILDNDSGTFDNVAVSLVVDGGGIDDIVASLESAGSDPSEQVLSSTLITDGLEIVDNSTHWYQVVVLGVQDSSRHIVSVMIRYRLGAGG